MHPSLQRALLNCQRLLEGPDHQLVASFLLQALSCTHTHLSQSGQVARALFQGLSQSLGLRRNQHSRAAVFQELGLRAMRYSGSAARAT